MTGFPPFPVIPYFLIETLLEMSLRGDQRKLELMNKNNNIPVLDNQQRFMSYTNPAKARILVNTGKARVFNKDPFMLQLSGETGDEEMAKVKRSARRGNIITNFTKYFAEEREVYVQNMGNTQISMTFGENHFVLIPRTRKPYNLTEEVPFEMLKGSTDFRRIVNRNPPILRLLTEDEFYEFYEKAAERNGTTFEEEFEIAQQIKRNLDNKVQLPSDTLQRKAEEKLAAKQEELEKPVELHPQIVGMCARADKDQGSMRISANDFIEDLESLASELTPEDWEFVVSKGVYKTVKNFASKEFDKLTAGDEDDE